MKPAKAKNNIFTATTQGLFLLALLIVSSFVLLNNPSITGRFFSDTEAFSADLRQNFTEDSSVNLEIIQEPPYELKSVKISGSISSNTDAKVYLRISDTEKLLIFDSSELQKEKPSGDFVTGAFTEGEETAEPASPPSSDINAEGIGPDTTTDTGDAGAESLPVEQAMEETVQPGLPPSSDTNASEEPANDTTAEGSPGAESQNDTEAENETIAELPIEEIVEEIATIQFTNECAGTCLLPEGLNASNYEIEIEVGSGSIIIDDVSYTLSVPSAEPLVNITVEVKDSSGKEVGANIDLLDENGNPIVAEVPVPEQQSGQNLPEQVFGVSKAKGQVQSKIGDGSFEIKPSNKHDLIVEISDAGNPIKKIEFKDIDATSDVDADIGIDDVPEKEDDNFVEVYAIDPTQLYFAEATVTVVAKGNALMKCKEWDFAGQQCLGEWVLQQSIIPGQEYTFTLTPEDPGYAETKSQTCAAEDNAAKGNFSGACQGTYPAACGSSGDRLSCDDGITEAHTYQKSLYGGVRITQFNTSVANCVAITNVELCYEWWRTNGAAALDCDISIGNQNGTNLTAVTTTCPGTSANPGVTCTNVTATKIWTCSNFFGSGSFNRSVIKSEITRVTSGAGTTETASWDVLYFKVNYTDDTTPPVISNVSASGITSNSTIISWTTDENANSSVNYGTTTSLGTIASNSSLVMSRTISLAGLSSSTLYYYNVSSCDFAGNCATSGLRNFTTSAAPDTTPPASVSNLGEYSKSQTWIAWNWTNPSDSDFSYVQIWIDGSYVANVSAPGNSYNASGFVNNSTHTIGTRTVDTSGNVNTTFVNDSATTLAEVTVTLNLSDATNSGVNSTVEIYEDGTLLNSYTGENVTMTIPAGKKKLRIRPTGNPIKEINFTGVNFNTNSFFELGLDDVPTNIGPSNLTTLETYAIDPTQLNFTNATFVVTAKSTATELYKCASWNFTTRTCTDGNWTKIADVTGGANYTVTITATDPAFSETKQPDSSAGKDSYVYGNTPTTNYGTDILMRVGKAAGGGEQRRRGIVEFDISNIPSNAKVTYAELNLTTSAGNSRTINIHRITNSWAEENVTWNSRDGTNNWATAGGDFNSAVEASASSPASANVSQIWNVTTLVQSWVNGTYSNFGMMIVDNDETSNSGLTFHSSDGGTAAYRPKLTINYVTPPLWSSQTQNNSNPPVGGTVLLSAFWNDSAGLSKAWLATNETGAWQNKSSVYGSPFNFSNATTNYSNFTWSNSSVLAGTVVGWRIYANNTESQENVTDIMAFTVGSADFTPPTVTIIRPENKTYNTQSNLPLNYTATDNVAVDKCWYSFDGGSNTSLPGCANSTFSVGSDGSHNVRVYSNDSSNNIGSDIEYFTVDTVPPQWSTQSSSTPATYSPSTLSLFNITWTDSLSGVNTVLLESNFSGSAQNYTMYLLSGNIYSFNRTLPAGTHYWKSYANDSAGNYNVSSQQNFTINKADNPTDLYLNGNLNSNTTITYGTQSNATGIVFAGTANLFRDDVPVANPEILTLAAKPAGYKYTVNTTGNQNYSSNGTAYYLIVNKANASMTLLLNGTASDKIIDYGTQSNATAFESNTGDSDVVYRLWRNSANVANGSSVSDVGILSAGTYVYVYNTSGGENYSASQNAGGPLVYTINPTTADVRLFLNGNEGNNSQNYGTSSNATATFNIAGLTFELLRNGTSVANGTSSINEIKTLAAGYYNYTAKFDGNENYSADSVTYFLTINKSASTLSLLINGSDSDFSMPINTNVSINASATTPSGATVNLYEDDSFVSNGTNPTAVRNYTTLGDRVWKVNITETENYTSGEKNHTISVVDSSVPQFSNLKESPTDPATYSAGQNYQFNATWTDDLGISNVILQFDGVNYSFLAGQLNNSGSEYYKNFGPMAAATYTYRWYSNDTSGNWASTGNQTYTIDKAIAALFLSFTPSSTISYGTTSTVSCSANNVESNPTMTRNATSVPNPDSGILAVGTYNYACTSGATQNFTSASVTGTLTVSKASPTINLTLNNQDSGITVTPNTIVNINASLVNPSSGNLTLKEDNITINSGPSPLSNSTNYTSEGTFVINASYDGNDNFTSGSKAHTITVSTVSPPPPPPPPSGGGGGGGGGAGPPSETPLAKGRGSETIVLRLNETYNYNLNGEAHTITFTRMIGELVELILTSEPITTTFKVKETKVFDITGDEISDIELTVISTTNNNTVVLRLTFLETSAISEIPAEAISAAPSAEEQAPLSQTERITGQAVQVRPVRGANPLYAVPTLLLMILLLAILALRHEQISEKLKRILTILHIALIVTIVALLFFTFAKAPVTGGAIFVPGAKTYLTTENILFIVPTILAIISVFALGWLLKHHSNINIKRRVHKQLKEDKKKKSQHHFPFMHGKHKVAKKVVIKPDNTMHVKELKSNANKLEEHLKTNNKKEEHGHDVEKV